MRLSILFILFSFFLNMPLYAVSDPFKTQFSDKPEHAVLIIVDGLSYKAWEKMHLNVMEEMINSGSLIEQTFLPPAAHPITGSYAELHTCSIPNPIMMSGAIFITKTTKYLQESFPPEKITAFVTNSSAYLTISQKYNHVYQVDGKDDDAIVNAVRIMKDFKPAFMRIHMQDTGGAGTQSMETKKNVEWKWNIWADNSPYRKSLTHADSLLGSFISELEKANVIDKTVIIITGDHGQNDTGWHPLEFYDSSVTTTIFWGAGIKKNVRVPYGELIDIVPTICTLMDVKPPATSQGRIFYETLSNYKGIVSPRKYNIRELNEQLIQYRKKKVEAQYLIENLQTGERGRYYLVLNREIIERFYDISKFSEWPRFKSIEELLENNNAVKKKLDELLAELKPNTQPGDKK